MSRHQGLFTAVLVLRDTTEDGSCKRHDCTIDIRRHHKPLVLHAKFVRDAITAAVDGKSGHPSGHLPRQSRFWITSRR